MLLLELVCIIVKSIKIWINPGSCEMICTSISFTLTRGSNINIAIDTIDVILNLVASEMRSKTTLNKSHPKAGFIIRSPGVVDRSKNRLSIISCSSDTMAGWRYSGLKEGGNPHPVPKKDLSMMSCVFLNYFFK